MAKVKIKSYWEQRAIECFDLLSSETFKMKPFFPSIVKNMYPYVDMTQQ